MLDDYIKYLMQFRMAAKAFAAQIRAAKIASLMGKVMKAKDYELKARRALTKAEKALNKAGDALDSNVLREFGQRSITQLNAYADALDKMVEKYDRIRRTLY